MASSVPSEPMITPAQLTAIMGCSPALAERYAEPLAEAMLRAEINTPLRQAHFLAQTGHECMGLSQMEELASGKDYNNRPDLGNTEPGDGERYKGHGAIQCTGKKNHLAFGVWMGVGDLFVREPRMIVTNPRFAIMTAAWYWITHKLNGVIDSATGILSEVTITEKGVKVKVAANSALARTTRIINGAYNGIRDRQRRFVIAKRALGIAS